ncbi:hypothetical protein D3C80_2103000 [compost metagenome]
MEIDSFVSIGFADRLQDGIVNLPGHRVCPAAGGNAVNYQVHLSQLAPDQISCALLGFMCEGIPADAIGAQARL